MTFRPSSWLGAGVLALLTHVLPGTSGAADWITTWGAAPQRLQAEGFVVENITPPTLTNRTIRQVVRGEHRRESGASGGVERVWARSAGDWGGRAARGG